MTLTKRSTTDDSHTSHQTLHFYSSPSPSPGRTALMKSSKTSDEAGGQGGGEISSRPDWEMAVDPRPAPLRHAPYSTRAAAPTKRTHSAAASRLIQHFPSGTKRKFKKLLGQQRQLARLGTAPLGSARLSDDRVWSARPFDPGTPSAMTKRRKSRPEFVVLYRRLVSPNVR